MSERQKVWITAVVCGVCDLTALTAAALLLRADLSLGRKLLCVWICALLLAGSVCLVAARRKIMRLKEQMGRSDQMLEEEQLRATGMELEKKRQELQALQSQINPHFFFNSLNGISSLIRKKNERMF